MTTVEAPPRPEISFQMSSGPLALMAELLDDLERTRIANENRYRQLTRTEVDKDGEVRGFGLPEDYPAAVAVKSMIDALTTMEVTATKNLNTELKNSPLHPWLKAQRGVGDKQGARLLAAIGDPYWNTLHGRPRTVSELWAFAGLHVNNETGTAVRRQKGQQSNWSSNAKMRSFLVSESIVKQLTAACKTDDGVVHVDGCTCAPLRKIYDARKAHTFGHTHAIDCNRCGPAGNPAKAGSFWSDAHRHADATRIVSKELLKQLWIESKRLHES